MFTLVPGCFLVDVVHGVFIDLCESLDCMLVDHLIIFFQSGLPFSLLAIMKKFSPLPGCQGTVPFGVPADVEDCDAVIVLCCDIFQQVLEGRSAARLVPSFPYCSQL